MPGNADRAPAPTYTAAGRRRKPIRRRALAGLWGVKLGPGDPCAAAVARSLRCLRVRGAVATIGSSTDPACSASSTTAAASPMQLLVGSGSDVATFNLAGTEAAVAWTELARVWRGDFATLWRAPAGYGDRELGGNPAVDAAWVGERLAAIDGGGPDVTGREALRTRSAAFQLSQGLTPDGVAGPLTIMQLARASHDDEPHLAR